MQLFFCSFSFKYATIATSFSHQENQRKNQDRKPLELFTLL